MARKTRAKILKAALICFANNGFTSTTLREVADEAETTHGLVRHYFGSKHLLWQACVSSALKQAIRMQRPFLRNVNKENAVTRFKSVIRALIRHSARNPELWKLLIFEALKDSERLDHMFDIVVPVHRRIDPLFHLVQEQGHLTDYTADEFFLILISLGAFPFAVSPMTNKLLKKTLQSRDHLKAHEERITNALFPAT